MRDDLEGVTIAFRRFVERPIAALARECRAADLVVVGRDPSPNRAERWSALDPGDAVLAAGRPVLVVPTGVRVCAARTIVLGWKDTREARRALLDAVPFLRSAEAVHVVGIAEGVDLPTTRVAVDDVVRHCGRHGIRAHGKARPLIGDAVADDLVLEAVEAGADLIVVGAWGRMRLREWAFGGATHDLLARAPMPVLLSH
ncbi:universal stress protein [Salinarimonas sp. NSM]|uniref:universal stress protein n=1 Tax=Salinarimonas sp. NSM TaxID=3458003 RepID=UPI004035C92B